MLTVLVAACAVGVAFEPLQAQTVNNNSATPSPNRAVNASEGPRWNDLRPAQRSALAPLQRDWATIENTSKLKWLEIAERFPSMPAEERLRIQARMSTWASLSPQERNQTRMRFQEAKAAPPDERSAQWKAYQDLPPDERKQLAERAPAQGSAKPTKQAAERDSTTGNGGRDKALISNQKINIVPPPPPVPPLKAISPSAVQAQPGATTTLISKRAAPPAHQQTGLPKITASPGFVDPSTLLPQRGAQGAAARDKAPPAPLAPLARP